MKNLKTTAFLLVFFCTVTFNSCQTSDQKMPQRSAKGDVQVGGSLRVAISKAPTLLLPADLNDLISSEIGLHLHQGLLSIDPQTLNIIPGLAESWSVDEAGTSYVFTLRKGATFHADECFGKKSREITAADFQYSFELACLSESFGSTFGNRVKGATEFHDHAAEAIEGITIIDDYTLSINLIKADPSFLFVLAQPSTAVISKKAVEKYGDKCVVGAGPFKMAAVGDNLLLVRNAEYYALDAFGNQLPYIDTLSYSIIPDKHQQLEKFFGGDLDLVSGLYLDPIKAVLEEHVSEFSGKIAKYVLQRDEESVGYESYSIFRATLKDASTNFMGYRDFTRVQIRK